ncbi:Carnitine O-palmitoyltransferase 1, liver isoform [Labeo rohita]|uniref:Carnitine O-palmitoyltransferase 1, liver isoform n=1 Tax=Labeo rohita TaxID=84645 RepID=A0ABQ8L4P0_LABRO|nr:Carnitine O-palmitoyltransferase 1, liver isoform [Labeo rohita]
MAMTGGGIDRHLLCLYIVSKYLGEESPFLKEVCHHGKGCTVTIYSIWQTRKCFQKRGVCPPVRLLFSRWSCLISLTTPEYTTCGGGFGPVADDGYGVSYIIIGENMISTFPSNTLVLRLLDSHKFGADIKKALEDLLELMSPEKPGQSKAEQNHSKKSKKDL